MSNSALEELRRQLESLDEKLHDLLMKRAELADRLGEMTRRSRASATPQLGQETALIRHLLARHAGAMPREAVARIWRELCASAMLGQGAQKIVVTVQDSQTGLVQWDMAKDYFGSVIPLHKVVNPLAALSLVKEKEVVFGILPWPENDATQAWWRFLMDEVGDSPLRIVARLPLGEYRGDNGNPEHKALVVGRVAYEGTGDDRSFIVLQLEHRISRGRIVDKAKMLGMTGLSLHSGTSAHPDYNDHLFEVSGYAGGDKGTLDQLLTLLESDNGKAVFVGGYPVPPLYDRQAQSAGNVATLKKLA